jgi:O-antigen/teichoic acid export membrane protein
VLRVIQSGVWLYLSIIVGSISWFIYWIAISRIAGSTILGLTSATIGLAIIINWIISLGLNYGIQHHLGYCIGHRDMDCFNKFFWTTTLFLLLVYIVSGSILVIYGLMGYSFLNYTPQMLVYTGILVILFFSTYMNSCLVSILRTDLLFYATLIGNVLRIGIGVWLVYIGWGFVGAVIGYMFTPALIIVVAFTHVIKAYGFKPVYENAYLLKTIRAGIVSWVPIMLLQTGQWAGVLTVYGTSGAAETGQYYLAQTIMLFIVGLGSSITALLLPVLSGMDKDRGVVASRVARISMALVSPIAIYTIFYSNTLLAWFGREYMGSAIILSILLTSFPPIILYQVANSLAYSRKLYNQVLMLGLAQNIPRLILYVVLTPLYGGLGAAYSYVTGAYTGLLYIIYLAKKLYFNVNWFEQSKTIILPLAMLWPISLIGLHWLVGLLVSLASYPLYVKMGVLDRNDLRDLSYAILGKEKSMLLYKKLHILLDYILG